MNQLRLYCTLNEVANGRCLHANKKETANEWKFHAEENLWKENTDKCHNAAGRQMSDSHVETSERF